MRSLKRFSKSIALVFFPTKLECEQIVASGDLDERSTVTGPRDRHRLVRWYDITTVNEIEMRLFWDFFKREGRGDQDMDLAGGNVAVLNPEVHNILPSFFLHASLPGPNNIYILFIIAWSLKG